MPFAPFTPTPSACVVAAQPSQRPGRSIEDTSAEAGPSSRPAAAPGAIQAIPRSDVHRITSGQVVLDLQGAVKELVENALDAGASNIEVRFKDYGAESIEVIDNGCGIAPENYAGVALKHHTSKLSSFDDLAAVRTFGFRGEALSSLCALGKVQIVTATKDDAPMGTVLELGSDGRVSSSDGKAARQRGTTVVVEQLFHSLPVRRREFEKNLKREYGKAQALLQAYALISKGVRWSASNTPKGGRKAASLSVVSASGPKYLGANATALFGPRVANTLDPFELSLELPAARTRVAPTQPRPPALKRRRLNAASSDAGTESDEERDAVPADDAAEESEGEPAETFRVSGLISRPEHGCGRSSTDKLFLYLNGRPWDNTRLARAFAEVYRTFTGQQPMVVADFHIDGTRYDVNVSPDKRTMLVHDEAAIVEQLKIQLEALFSPSRGTFAIAGALGTATARAAQSKLAFAATAKSYAALVRPQEEAPAASTSDVEMETAGEAEARDATPPPAASAPPSPTLGASRARAESAASVESEGDPSSDLPNPSALWRSIVRPVRPEAHSAELHRARDASADDEAEMPASPASSQPDVPVAPAQRRVSSPPDEPVLDTTRASWSPVRRTARVDDAPARRERDVSGRSRSPVAHARSKVPAVSSAALRSQLANSLRGFARPGTQVGTLHAEATEAELEYRESMPPSSEDDDEPGEAAAAGPTSEQQGVAAEILAVDADEDEDAAERGRHLAALEQALGEPAPPTAARAWRDEMPNVDAASAADETPLPFDLDVLRARVQSKARRLASVRTRDAATERDAAKRITGAGIAAQDAGHVESELSRVISKRDFTSMTVAGQFNLGFIIARRRPALAADTEADAAELAGQMDDLFIVDQHAADEKYNFEMLQRETKIRSQQLISPRTLELSPSDELVAAEHVETLRANGFDIVVDDESPPGSRVKLLSQPVSAKIVFGVRDLEELLHLLRDVAPAVAGEIRCSKVRAMHASRACRRSVMVGTALSQRQMSNILLHFSTLDQPWNCPHGRPTLRHLADLRTVKTAARDSTGAQRFAQRPVDWSAL